MTNDEQDTGKKDADRKGTAAKNTPARRPKREARDDKPKDTGPPPVEEDAPRPRRRLPYAALVLLALVGVGLYVVWPTLQERIDAPSFEPDEPEVVARADLEDTTPEVTSGLDTPDIPEVPSGVETPPPASTVSVIENDLAKEVDARLAALDDAAESALAALDARLATLEQAIEETTQPPADSAPFEALNARLDALEATLAALPASPASDAGTALRLEALEALLADAPDAMPALNAANLRLNRLESRIAALTEQAALPAEWESANAALASALAAATARLSELEAALSRETGAEARLVALVFAAGRLNTALSGPTPFARELAALGALVGDDAGLTDALTLLRPMSREGVQTLEGLRGRFPDTASAIVRASAVPEDASWVDETVAKLSQIVTVRRTDATLDPESRDGRLLEAEHALIAGDLAAAVDAMEGLPGEQAAAWLAAARARLAADAALDAIDERVLALVEERWPASAE